MTKYALYMGSNLVRIADSLEGWNFHPYRGNKGFVEVTDEQAGRLEQELLDSVELKELALKK